MPDRYHLWLERLKENPEQWNALNKSPHTVVIAGPGSGKTRVLSLKIAQLVRSDVQPPHGIACLTYTRTMAQELRTQLQALGVSWYANVLVGTVHSFCLREIVFPFAKLFAPDYSVPIRVAPKAVQFESLDQARQAVQRVSYDPESDRDFKQRFEVLRRQRMDQDLSTWSDNEDIAEIIGLYEHLLIQRGYLDFDMIVKTAIGWVISHAIVRQSLACRFKWLAVDEYQDLGYPLFRLVTELVDKTPMHLFAIGDPNQCIYDFAGTNPIYLRQLSERPDTQPTVTLTKNYRCTKEIIDVSSVIIRGTNSPAFTSALRGGKCRIFQCSHGDTHQYQHAATLVKEYHNQGIKLDEIAVLHRKREPLKQIAVELQRQNLSFMFDHHPDYDRNFSLIRWLEDVAYWTLNNCCYLPKPDEQPRTSFQSLYQTWYHFMFPDSTPEDATGEDQRILFTKVLWRLRGIDWTFWDWVNQLIQLLDLKKYLESYSRIYPDEVEEFHRLLNMTSPEGALAQLTLADFANVKPGVRVTTLHSAKGMEFEVVIICGVESIEDSENGQRLFYVGVTRSKRDVCLLFSLRSRFNLPEYIAPLRNRQLNYNLPYITFERLT